MKIVSWVLGAKKELLAFPEEVLHQVGYALHLAQCGETHRSAKLFKGHGSGVYEVVIDYNKCTYRVLYSVQRQNNIDVLYAFQKKSNRGIKTPLKNLKIIEDRLKLLK